MPYERIGPGVVRRARRRPIPSPARQASAEEVARELARLEHHRKSREGEAKRDDEQALLAWWCAHIGVPHALLVKQLPQFASEWGFDRLEEAMRDVAGKCRGKRMDSWDHFKELTRLFRLWRRAPR